MFLYRECMNQSPDFGTSARVPSYPEEKNVVSSAAELSGNQARDRQQTHCMLEAGWEEQ